MYKQLFVIAILILSLGCTNTSAPKDSEESKDGLGRLIRLPNVKPVEANVYDAALANSLKDMPIDRLCQESKGYKNNQWEGMNECSWAVEKYQIAKNKDQVQRQGDKLFLQLVDDFLELVHQKDLDGKPTNIYYQYKGYLASIGAYYLEVYRENQCPQSWIVYASTGDKTILDGPPVFNEKQDAFMLSTVDVDNASCKNEIAYWQLTNNTFSHRWSCKPEQVYDKLVWVGKNQWIGRDRNTSDQSANYFQISAQAPGQ